MRVLNPIYREVILRVLAAKAEDKVTANPAAFIADDGTLNYPKLLDKFTAWWPENGEILNSGPYHEAAPHLVLMAFLHRIVNGGGFIDREYHAGYKRIDLLIRWPYIDQDGQSQVQREAMELKVWHPTRPDPLDKGSWNNSTATSTGSALTPVPWSSSIADPTPNPSPNAP